MRPIAVVALVVLVVAEARAQDFQATPAACELWRPYTCTTVVEASRAVVRVEPEYPFAARKTHKQGVVRVQVSIDAGGNVTNAAVLDGPPLFGDAAVAAALRWRFSPFRLNHRSVPSTGVVTFRFVYEGDQS